MDGYDVPVRGRRWSGADGAVLGRGGAERTETAPNREVAVASSDPFRLPRSSGAAGPTPRAGRPWRRGVSRVLFPGAARGGHLSRTPVARRLARPTRSSSRRAAARFLFGLAAGGVCRAARRRRRARWALTPPLHPCPCVRRPLSRVARPPSAVCSLLHWPSPRGARVFPGSVPCAARTFLEPRLRRRRAAGPARDLSLPPLAAPDPGSRPGR